MMRKMLLAAAAALALSSSVMAQPVVGYGELSYGSLSANTGGASIDVLTVGGAANVPFASGWNFELEGWGSSLTAGGVGGGSLMGVYGHAYMRDPTNWAGGLYAGYENIIAGATLITAHSIGLEAAKFWGPAVIIAQGRWATVETAGTSVNLASIEGTARYRT